MVLGSIGPAVCSKRVGFQGSRPGLGIGLEVVSCLGLVRFRRPMHRCINTTVAWPFLSLSVLLVLALLLPLSRVALTVIIAVATDAGVWV